MATNLRMKWLPLYKQRKRRQTRKMKFTLHHCFGNGLISYHDVWAISWNGFIILWPMIFDFVIFQREIWIVPRKLSSRMFQTMMHQDLNATCVLFSCFFSLQSRYFMLYTCAFGSVNDIDTIRSTCDGWIILNYWKHGLYMLIASLNLHWIFRQTKLQRWAQHSYVSLMTVRQM